MEWHIQIIINAFGHVIVGGLNLNWLKLLLVNVRTMHLQSAVQWVSFKNRFKKNIRFFRRQLVVMNFCL